MRDIKFRTWNSVLHEYRTLDMNSGKQNLGMGFEVTGGIGSNITTIYRSVGDVIEQYTGINDKNGVEIYEGDIIDTHWGNEENRLVKYDDEMGFYLTPDQDQHYWTLAYRGEYEVIGNIHENADLLEETT